VQVHWPLFAVLATFAASMVIVPTFANVTLSDDWVYLRSVRILVDEARLDIHPLVSSHLVFQVLWAGLFGAVLDVSPGVARFSMVVLWLLSGVACYGLAWELTGKRGLSAIATGAYLFNPLGYVLAFSFMTDAPFTALLVISTYCTVRAVRSGVDGRWLVAGSFVAALAVLERQPGVFIPPAVLLALFALRRLPVSPRGVVIGLQVGVLPLLTYIALYLWMQNTNGASATQSIMTGQLIEGGLGPLATHAERLSVIEAAYLGLFVLPITAGAVVGIRGLVHGMSPRAWVCFVVWWTFVIAGFMALRALGMRMPYIPHFMSDAGLGPNDLLGGGRLPIIDARLRTWLTLLCVASAAMAGFLVIRAFDRERGRIAGVVVVLMTLGVQAIGALIVSTHFRHWIIQGVPAPSLDRYVLPLLPLALVAAVWAVRNVEVHLPLAWYVTTVLAVFAVAGTRDNLVFHQANWDLAQETVDSGIPLTKLDGGAAWTGYHVGERSYEELGIPPAYPGAWWLGLYGGVIDPEYVIAATELAGYTTVREYRYDLWLDRRPTALYLLHRNDASP
jgi:4-amino-4-deoxy-L-arabinose transferase-like glycosyltransferase